MRYDIIMMVSDFTEGRILMSGMVLNTVGNVNIVRGL